MELQGWQAAGTEKVPERKLGEGRLRSRLGVQEDRGMDAKDKDKEELWIIRKAKGNLAIDEEQVVEVDDGEEAALRRVKPASVAEKANRQRRGWG